MKASILIVGGGIMGTSIALRAAQRADSLKGPVVLCERTSMGAGSTGRSGAILRQHYSDRAVALMARDSLRDYGTFEQRTGRPIGFRRSGVLTLAGPEQPDWAERLRANVAMLAEHGVDTEIVEAPRIRELVPGIAVKQGTVGAWEPGAGFVDPLLTVNAFASLARTYGAVTRLGCEVTKILVEDGRVVGAETSEGRYAADKVVVVAGPWSGRILGELGVELPLRVLRPENVYVTMPDSEDIEEEVADHGSTFSFDMEDASERDSDRDDMNPRGLHPVLIDLERDLYVRCEPPTRRTRAGRTEYAHDKVLEDPDAIGEEVSTETKEWARSQLVARLPEYGELADAGTIVGWYTLSPDAQAVIGPAPGVAGLYVAAGFSGHGFKLAPSVGEGMGQMLFGEPVTAFEPEFFDPQRFQGEPAWSGRFGL